VGKGTYSADKDTVYMSRDLLNSDSAEAESIPTEEVDHAGKDNNNLVVGLICS